MKKNYPMAFQKLQYQYVMNTSQPILLYYYGKYICLCETEEIRRHFLASGISSLSEAMRSCYSGRHDKIRVWLGKAYALWHETIVSVEYCSCVSALASSSKQTAKLKEDKSCFKYLKEIEAMRSLLGIVAKRCNKGQSNLSMKNAVAIEFNHALKVLDTYDKEVKNYVMILYAFYIQNSPKEAQTGISAFADRLPPLLYAYVDFWKIARRCKNPELGVRIAECLSLLLERYDYPNDQWIKANVTIAKSLMLDHKVPKHEEAKSVLHQLAQVIPPLPLPGYSEYESMEFAENQMFYLLNAGGDKEAVQSTSFIEEDVLETRETGEETKESEKQIEFVDMVKLPSVKIENPQLDYVKKVNHRKKSSAFQEHMAFQMEVEREFKNAGPRSRKNSARRVLYCINQ
eukprot:TRINITY_DN8518_c0_g1_i15.p1 TRINITY_DN8518_c0_g1~~TRINITY_DN8518_c0_g1_i15.p1  ORF type:complete len:401 (-),score=114.54 TRINITY_DN8518_c0_g1_i15:214-1416(-)